MTDKYIELEDQIIDANDLARDYMCSCYDLGVEAALEYLDRNTDRAPGPTLTASEFERVVESCETEDYTVPPHTFAARLGITVVPDPEPTNAERLAEAISEIIEDHGRGIIIGRDAEVNEFAASLDRAGVRAPKAGGDDDH